MIAPGNWIRICDLSEEHVQSLRFAAGPNLGVRPAADKSFYLRLTVEKVCVFGVFPEKHLRPYGCISTYFTAAVNCTNPKTKIQSEIIEIQIIEVQTLATNFLSYIDVLQLIFK